jgi:hypothetical protein
VKQQHSQFKVGRRLANWPGDSGCGDIGDFRRLWSPDGKAERMICGVGGVIIRNRAGYAGAAEGPTQPTITGVIDHISWGIDPWDTAKVKAELEKRGLDPRPDMNGKFQSFHVHDPDGWDLQISNQTDTSQL